MFATQRREKVNPSVPAAMLAAIVWFASFSSAALAAVWTNTGSMATARYSHTATLLPNGTVLVAGGTDRECKPGPGNCVIGPSVLAGAELYDPVAGTWSSTGSMIATRFLHTATLLPNGMVLVAGGSTGAPGGGSGIATAELYDPAAGTWSATAVMATARSFHIATLLQDGKVVVAGGKGTSSVLASAELYAFTKDDCKNREWQNFTAAPGPFKNQGQCIQGVK